MENCSINMIDCGDEFAVMSCCGCWCTFWYYAALDCVSWIPDDMSGMWIRSCFFSAFLVSPYFFLFSRLYSIVVAFFLRGAMSLFLYPSLISLVGTSFRRSLFLLCWVWCESFWWNDAVSVVGLGLGWEDG